MSSLRKLSCLFYPLRRQTIFFGIILMLSIYPAYEMLRPTTLADEIFSNQIPDSGTDTISDRIFEKYLPLGSSVKEVTVFLVGQGFKVHRSHLGATPSTITNEMRLTQEPTNLWAIFRRSRVACSDEAHISMDVKNEVITHVHFYVSRVCL